MKRFLMFLSVAVIFSLTVLLTQESVAAAPGFSNGTAFKSIPVAGTLFMTCQSPGAVPRTVTFNCRDSILTPVEQDYFVGPVVDADTVSLSAIHGDGSDRVKSASYDGQNGISTSRFNLWLVSLLQRPLLADGNNTVHYTLTKNKAVVAQGDFPAPVTPQPTAVCPTDQEYSTIPSDCDNQFTACGSYFEKYNYCN